MERIRCPKRLLSLLLVFCMVMGTITVTPKKVEAAGSYWLKVNRQRNTVTAYKYQNGKYKATKAMVCSVGKNGATPRGNFNTQQKLRWHILMGNVWGQYCTRIYKGYLFHSVWYYSQNKATQSTKQYNKLGSAASHGCVRLTVADSKWIYDKCPLGTKVTIYDSSDAGPLGKPKAIKVSRSRKMWWDPTDPDPNNPYSQRQPTIKISANKPKTVDLYGEAYNLKQGVSAKSYSGKNITSKIKVKGKVNHRKAGTYTLVYTVTDNGYSASKTFKVRVKKASKPLMAGMKNRSVEIGNGTVTVDMMSGVKAVDVEGTDITKYVRMSCDGDSVTVSNRLGKIRFSKPGTYKVAYTVTGYKKNGAKTTTQNVKVAVKDDSTPSITQKVISETVDLGSVYDDAKIRAGVTAATVKKTNLTKKITYTGKVDTQKAGTYQIKYTVTSPTGRTAYEARTVTVLDRSEPAVLITDARDIAIDSTKGLSREEIGKMIRDNIRFTTVKGTDLSETSRYEIYKVANGQETGPLAVPVEALEPGVYHVYYFCTNPSTAKETPKKAVKNLIVQ